MTCLSHHHEEKQKSIEPGIYEHYGGGRYEVLGEALFSENPDQKLVIYKSLYAGQLSTDNSHLPIGTLWARPREMFMETFTDTEGKAVKRFKKIS